MENQTHIKGFKFLPFSANSDSTSLITVLFFLLYIFGVIINTIIITVIFVDKQLQTPMYLFLCNLALVDICFTTTTVPNLLYMLLSEDNTMSFIQCFTQLYFYLLVGCTEDVLIFILAYDRYVAICHPLHYHRILNTKNCLLISSGIWISGFLNSFVITVPVLNMSFCQSKKLQHFFCDPKALIHISCAGKIGVYFALFLELLLYGFLIVVFSVISYIKIIRVILQIKSKDGRKKAFSTCSSHLTVVAIYYMTGLSVYMIPPFEHFVILDQTLTALYSVITPTINPLIYSLRNKDVKMALLRLLGVNSKTKTSG